MPSHGRRGLYHYCRSFALSVAYNVVFISVISQLEPSIFAFALIHGISVITGSSRCREILHRRRNRSHHTWDWLNIFMSNAMIVVVLGFSIGVALSSWLASSDESDNLCCKPLASRALSSYRNDVGLGEWLIIQITLMTIPWTRCSSFLSRENNLPPK